LGYKGSAWAEIRITRNQAHTAGQGESACEAAFTLWGAVRAWTERFNQGRQRIFDQVLPNLQGFESGEDGFRTWACLRVGARLPLDCGPEAWYTALERLCAGAELRQTGFPLPAYQAEKNSLLVRAFLAGIRASGGQPGFVLKSGTADLNLAAPAWGCPAAAYGPGDSSLDHTPEEHASLGEYTRSVEVLSIVLERVCKG
jgi:LysW-gamma-L-lysine carboxypeptidase